MTDFFDSEEFQNLWSDSCENLRFSDFSLCFVLKSKSERLDSNCSDKFKQKILELVYGQDADGPEFVCSNNFIAASFYTFDKLWKKKESGKWRDEINGLIRLSSNTILYILGWRSSDGHKMLPLFVSCGNLLEENDFVALEEQIIEYLGKNLHGYFDNNSIDDAVSLKFINNINYASQEEIVKSTIYDAISFKPICSNESLPILANALMDFSIKFSEKDDMGTYRNYLVQDKGTIIGVDDKENAILDTKILGYYKNSPKGIQIRNYEVKARQEIVLCPTLINEAAFTISLDDIDFDSKKDSLLRKVLLHELSHLLLDSSINYRHFYGCDFTTPNNDFHREIELRAIEESLANYLCLWYCAKIYGTNSDTFRVADYFIRNCQPLMYKFGTKQYNANVDWTKWLDKKKGTFTPEFLSKAKEWYDVFVVGNKPYTADDYNQLFND